MEIADRLVGATCENNGAGAVPGPARSPWASGLGAVGLGVSPLAVSLLMSEMYWVTGAERHLKSALSAFKRAAALSREQPLTRPSLYSGTGGYLLAADDLLDARPALQPVFDKLAQSFAAQVRSVTENFRFSPLGSWDFDAIEGVAGLAQCLLALRHPIQGRDSLLRHLATLLTRLADIDQAGVPRCVIDPSSYLPGQDFLWRDYPDGFVNLGYAHGIPGLLSALAAVAPWAEPERAYESVRNLRDWIMAQHLTDSYGVSWANGYPVGGPPLTQSARSAWCYGAPGVALALYRAAEALRDQAGQQEAGVLLEAAVARGRGAERDSVTVCHGKSGLLAISLVLAPGLSPGLAGEVAGLLDPAAPYGVRDTEQDGALADDPGLLTGATGVALVQLYAATGRMPAVLKACVLGSEGRAEQA
ncbi:MAG TPA: lanthionine synthetase LanC family protein [Streptosporangiaceae bacterium]